MLADPKGGGHVQAGPTALPKAHVDGIYIGLLSRQKFLI